MNTTAHEFLTQHDEPQLLENCPPAAPAECLAPLADENRHALRKYWDSLIWDAWIPPAERVRVPTFAELDERRAQRRMRRQAAASEPLPTPQRGDADPDLDAA